MTKEVSKEVVTLRDVAREAGVSAQSVSIVLNGKAEQYRISTATQQRVEKVAAQLGYDPDNNRSARQLAARKYGIKMLNNVIAVCSNPSSRPVHQQPFESDILDGIEIEAEKRGLDVLTCRLRTERLPRLLAKKEVDGIITLSSTPARLRLLRRLNIPIVHLGSASPAIHSVSAEHYQGMLSATSHLINLGHRQVAFIGHDVNRTSDESTLADAAKERYRGFCAAMATAKLPVEFVENSLLESFPNDGACAFKMLWEQSRHTLTAVVCYNDTLAMGVIKAARGMDIKVPQDLSVVGFDAVSARFSFELPITSVGYDRVLMGKRATDILDKCRHGKVLSPKGKGALIHEELPVHFVEGATTAPPRK